MLLDVIISTLRYVGTKLQRQSFLVRLIGSSCAFQYAGAISYISFYGHQFVRFDPGQAFIDDKKVHIALKS